MQERHAFVIDEVGEKAKEADARWMKIQNKAGDYDGYYVRFYYEVKIPERKDEYKADLKKHEEAVAQYEKDLKVYSEFCRQQKIRETEEKLARLKTTR